MSTDRLNDLRAFRDFLDATISKQRDTLTLDECLDLWEHENSSEQEREETLEAIRCGLADVEADRVRPAREALDELRRKHNLPGLPWAIALWRKSVSRKSGGNRCRRKLVSVQSSSAENRTDTDFPPDFPLHKSRAIELRNTLEEMMKGHPELSQYQSFYVKPEDQAKLTPQEIEIMREYSGLQDAARKYARERRRIGAKQWTDVRGIGHEC
jgi:hypothetical protein